MPEKFLEEIGNLGVNLDKIPSGLDPKFFSTATNARFDRGRARSFAGDSQISAVAGTYYYLLPVQGEVFYYWYLASTTGIKEWDGNTLVDRTNVLGAYTGVKRDRWNGGHFHGIPILNNGIDPPQYLLSPGSGAFLDLPWDSGNTWRDKNWSAKVIRTWRNFVIALNVDKDGSYDPHLFIWSDAADPGTIPTTWDKDDVNNLAGEYPLSDTNGHLVDAMPLGRDLIVYKEDAIYRVSFVSSPNIFRFDLITDEYGMRAQGCAIDVGGAHIVVGHNGVFIHDGSTITPLAYGRVSEYLFGDLSGVEYSQMYLSANPSQYEVWICYPDQSADVFPNKCMVFNHKDNAFYPRELASETAFITPGVDLESTGADEIQELTGTIAAQDWRYNDRTYNPTLLRLHGCSGSKFKKYDVGTTFDGSNPTCKIERKGLSLGRRTNADKIVTAMYPEMEASAAVDFYVGHQLNVGAAVTWEGPFSFNPNTDKVLEPFVCGPLIAWKLQSTDGTDWEISGINFEYEIEGEAP